MLMLVAAGLLGALLCYICIVQASVCSDTSVSIPSTSTFVSAAPVFGGQSALFELLQRRVIVAAVTGMRHIKLWVAFPDKTENPSYMGVDWYNLF